MQVHFAAPHSVMTYYVMRQNLSQKYIGTIYLFNFYFLKNIFRFLGFFLNKMCKENTNNTGKKNMDEKQTNKNKTNRAQGQCG